MEEVTEFPFCKLKDTCEAHLSPGSPESAVRPPSLPSGIVLPVTTFRGQSTSISFCQGLRSFMLQGMSSKDAKVELERDHKNTRCEQTLQAVCLLSPTLRDHHIQSNQQIT